MRAVGQAVDQAVQERLGRGVDPVQVLHDHEQRLDLARPQQQARAGLQGALAALRRLEGLPVRVVHWDVQKRQHGWQGWHESLIQRAELAHDLVADRLRLVARVQLEVGLEQVDDGEVRGLLPVGDRAAFEDQPAVGALRLRHLIAQAGFADARLPDEADDLPTALGDLRQEVAQVCQLPLPAHEATQGALPVHLQRGASRPHPHDGVGADAVSHACTCWALPPVQLEPPLDQPPDLGRQQNIPWRGLPEQPHRQRQRLPQRQEPCGRVARLAHPPAPGRDARPCAPPGLAACRPQPGPRLAGAGWPGPPAPRAAASAPASAAGQRRP